MTARISALVLVILSVALVTVSVRGSGDDSLQTAQRAAVRVLAPLEVAGERVTRPFRDAAAYVSELFRAKGENAELERQVEELRRQVIENETAARENEELRALLEFRDGPRFPEGYRGVATRVIGKPASVFQQEVVIAAGASDGVRPNDPVVAKEGLVGLVTAVAGDTSTVMLLADQASAVSAEVVQSGAEGVVRAGPSEGGTLVLDRVGKHELVNEGDTVITAGWRSGKLESLYPKGIPIGTVTGVGQQDVDLYKRVQVAPLVDFDSLSEVLVLVRRGAR